MAHLHGVVSRGFWRVVALALLLLGMCVSAARADTLVAATAPVQLFGPWTYSGNLGCGTQVLTAGTPEDLVAAEAARASSCQTDSYSVHSPACAAYDPATATSATCYLDQYRGGTLLRSPAETYSRTPNGMGCPGTTTMGSDSMCHCPAVGTSTSLWDVEQKTCVTPAPPDSGQAALCSSLSGQSFQMSTQGSPGWGTATCDPSGCASTWGSMVRYTDKTTGKVTTEGTVTYTGSTCTYDASKGDTTSSGTSQASKDTCPGGAVGTVNGVSTCVKYSPDQNTIESVKPSGTTTTSSVTANGTTTSTTTSTGSGTTSTKCDGEQCTTTTTVVKSNPDGTTATTTTTDQQPQDDFCKANPTATQCKDSDSKWGGACGSGFTCDGDAVMCAAAQAVWQQKCALVDGPATKTAEQVAYDNAVSGTGTDNTLSTTTVAISSASFDSSNALGVAAQCVTDKTYTVWGHSISVGYSQVCPFLGMLGTVLLAVSWLVAAVLVGKGVNA